MGIVIFNAVLYILPLFLYWRKRGTIDLFVVVLSLYAITALLCVFNYHDNPNDWPGIKLFPFIYLFFVLTILFLPIQQLNLNKMKLVVNDNRPLRLLAAFFIICSVVSIYINISDTLARIQSGDWGMLRQDLYNDTSNIALYSSPFDRFLKNTISYLKPFAVPYMFFLMTLKKTPAFFTLLLTLCVVITSFIGATVVASRGMIVYFLIELCLAYLLFKNIIPQKRKKAIYITAVVMLVLMFVYMIVVTISRFGDDKSGESVVYYLGHSMLAFNDGVFGKVHTYAKGKMFFQWFIDVLGGNSYYDQIRAGATHGTAFYTIVGGMYFDFGFVGTIVAAVLAIALVDGFFKKRTLRLADCIIIVFYSSRIADGSAVLGRGGAITWFMTFVVYFIVRYLESLSPSKKHSSTTQG